VLYDLVVIRYETENDVDILRSAAIILDSENKKLIDENRELAAEVRRLKGQEPLSMQQEIDRLKELLGARERALFSESTEKRKNGDEATKEKEKKPRRGHGPTAQLDLPVQEKVHGIEDPEDLVCPICNGLLEEMKGQYEESEEITVIRREFVVVRHRRKKYRCKCNGHVKTAPGPKKLKPGARYSPEFAVEVASDKYVDHMPLQRQVKSMASDGLKIGAQTLWDQIDTLAAHLEPCHEAIHKAVLESLLVFADETRWRLTERKKKSKKPYMWAVATPVLVAYRILPDRSAKSAAKILDGYQGTVMADGYSAYSSLSRDGPQCELGQTEDGPNFKLVHCWAHSRRKYVEIEKNYPDRCGEILDLIAELYAQERQVPHDLPPDEKLELRARLRNANSRWVIGEIKHWAEHLEALPESGLGKARDYMMGIWEGLTAFLDDPTIPLDNNLVERALRPPVVGRKNHYGSRSQRGLRVAEVFYTLVESAKLTGVDPRKYLMEATRRALREPGTVTMPADLIPK
jgi:transposase